jgi:hypothetical protein
MGIQDRMPLAAQATVWTDVFVRFSRRSSKFTIDA